MRALAAWRCPVCMSPGCATPQGECHCGCGELAPIAKKTATKYGHVKGLPIRYINGHYQRSTRLSPVDYVIDEGTGCWTWQRSVTRGGYGHLRESGRMQYAHRLYYERLRGPIPAGLQLDHLCRNPRCVNPEHLEPVTCQENTLRGNTIAARRKAQSHCIRGHEFTEANTIARGRNRACRECQRQAVRESQRRRRAKQAEARVPYPRKRIKDFPPIDYWVDPSSGCWVWQRYLGLEGYALKRRDGKKIPAHRYYYEMYRGPIPSGLMMDHLCRNRACVNPYHLEPVTAKENAARRDRAKGKRALRVLR
jgi:HNH endonuclease